jgi:FMN reductase
MTAITVLGIAGSEREDSRARTALQVALKAARKAGAKVEVLDVSNLDGRASTVHDLPQDEVADRVGTAVANADALIVATPTFHGGISGPLRTILESIPNDAIAGKATALVSVTGGSAERGDPLEPLRQQLQGLHAWVVPNRAVVPFAFRAFDRAGNPTDPDVRERLETVGREVARYGRLLQEMRPVPSAAVPAVAATPATVVLARGRRAS